MYIFHFVCLLRCKLSYSQFFLGNPDFLDVNFDFQKTTRILVETFPSETEILAYEI